MKNTIIFLSFLSLVIILSSFSGCGKDIVKPKSPDPCLSMYDERSEPYQDLYKGTLDRGCLISMQPIFPDKHTYQHLCTNPNNPYEIAYLRDKRGGAFFDLFKYNFCTGEETFLIYGAVSPDWSVKDWIVFSKGLQLWKIKSNGDSLTQMTHASGAHLYPRWSPNGTKCLYNNKSIVDENGVVLQRLHEPVYGRTWKDNNTIIFVDLGASNPFNVKEYNLLNDNVTITHSIPIYGNSRGYLRATNELIVEEIIDHDSSNMIIYSLATNQSRLISEATDSYFMSPVKPLGLNRFVYTRVLQDTFTHTYCEYNIRNHIAIMNLDGTDERHVLLPE